jgi:hypothetical protein
MEPTAWLPQRRPNALARSHPRGATCQSAAKLPAASREGGGNLPFGARDRRPPLTTIKGRTSVVGAMGRDGEGGEATTRRRGALPTLSD